MGARMGKIGPYELNSIITGNARELAKQIPDESSVHKWQKPSKALSYYLKCFSKEFGTVLDFFNGSGSVPVVCKMLNRQYLAFEIDPETADLARQRVANTQPPLPIQWPEQLSLMD